MHRITVFEVLQTLVWDSVGCNPACVYCLPQAAGAHELLWRAAAPPWRPVDVRHVLSAAPVAGALAEPTTCLQPVPLHRRRHEADNGGGLVPPAVCIVDAGRDCGG
jgi:hypothetical protein